MPKTITKEIYTFRELLALREQGLIGPRVIDQVREKLQGWATDGEWYEYAEEDWKAALAQIGFMQPEIQFSGFSSQGDGASFTAQLDIGRLALFFSTPTAPSPTVAPFPDDPKVENWVPWLVEKTKFADWTDAYRHLPRITDYLEGEVSRRDHHYVHQHTCRTSLALRGGQRELPRIERVVNEFEAAIEALRLKLCRTIYKSLEEEYWHRIADEQLIEDGEANQWHFDTSGRLEG